MTSVSERNPVTVEKVKQIISEQLGVEENEVTPSAAFMDDLGADSLDQVELVMALEEPFTWRFLTKKRRKSAPCKMQSIMWKNMRR